MLFNVGVRAIALLIATLTLWAMPGGAFANPFYAQQTGEPCASCHLPGQENAGAQGLNPTGQAFCVQSVPGCPLAPQRAARTTENASGMATFSQDICAGQPRYVTIELAGSVPITLVLDRGMRVHVLVSQNSSYASLCGALPPAGVSFTYIDLD